MKKETRGRKPKKGEIKHRYNVCMTPSEHKFLKKKYGSIAEAIRILLDYARRSE